MGFVQVVNELMYGQNCQRCSLTNTYQLTCRPREQGNEGVIVLPT